MKKILALSLLGLGLVGSASAMNVTGTVWGCSSNANTNTPSGYQWCKTTVTSATTATQLGRIAVSPKQLTLLTFGVSGSAVANVVTPTISYYVGSQVVATQNVSVSTVGNVVVPAMASQYGVPFFTALSVSQSTPSLISATNGLVITVQQNDK